ncbi:MAG: cytochrome c peroxidase [Alphaproteobacteria bacterium]|nr:cytochrome c peroxidase [Alphaproteobacteria bacterium]
MTQNPTIATPQVRPRRAPTLLLTVGLALAAIAPAVRAEGTPPPINDADYRQTDPARVALGRLLFYDKILSGNQNIACGTCHHHDLATGDGLSLPIGEGGVGLGPERSIGAGPDRIQARVPRNSPPLFNLGAEEFTVMFHDGRLTVDASAPGGFNSPADDNLPEGLNHIIAAQAMFPVTSPTEMAGALDENDIAKQAAPDIEDLWEALAKRLRAVPEYALLFGKAYPEIERIEDITYVHAANAIGDFISFEWRADDSPFDRYLRGDGDALTAEQKRGMDLFYGEAGCAACHSGKFQTDHGFHAIAMPQLGAPRTRLFDPVIRDRGRINESDQVEDAYKFRTPSLRNVAQTGPYGHSGAYRDLEAMVRHVLDPVAGHANYDRRQAVLPKHPYLSAMDWAAQENARETAALVAAVTLEPVDLADADVAALVAFLNALTDPASLKGRLGRPETVPSGLPVD